MTKQPGQLAYEALTNFLLGPNAKPNFDLCDGRGKAGWAAVEQAITSATLQRLDEAVANAERRAREEEERAPWEALVRHSRETDPEHCGNGPTFCFTYEGDDFERKPVSVWIEGTELTGEALTATDAARDLCAKLGIDLASGVHHGERAMSPRDLTAEEIAELEKLRAEVDRLHGHFIDGGTKSLVFAQQLSYAEEDLGRKMCDKRAHLLAMVSRLLELETDLRKRTIEICELVPEDAPVEAKQLIDMLALEVTCEWERANMAEARLRELEAAIEFLNTRGVWQNTRPEGIIQTARDYGFPGLNAKGGENG